MSPQTADNPLANKNPSGAGPRLSTTAPNGYINQPGGKMPNLIHFDDSKRTNPQSTDGPFGHPQFGKTLNVPPGGVLQALPAATPSAPVIRPRPAIMTTPKSASTAAKNLSLDLPPAEARPTLLVTAGNDQRQAQTTIAPNNRRLPLNGKLVPVPPVRQQPAVPKPDNEHQTINELTAKKHVTPRPRTALFFSAPRTRSPQSARTERDGFLSSA